MNQGPYSTDCESNAEFDQNQHEANLDADNANTGSELRFDELSGHANMDADSTIDEHLECPFQEEYIRIVCMFINIGTDIILKLFKSLANNDVAALLQSEDSKNKLLQLEREKVLSSKEFKLVSRDNPNLDDIDICLLISLMINLLSEDNLGKPKRGWRNPPDPKDFSIAAELLRLRKKRNFIVAHRSKAYISLSRFEREWSTTKDIFLRLAKKIMPDKLEDIGNRIEAYKVDRLQPSDTKKAKTLLDKWEEKNKDLQEKVEDLFKKIQEFDKYFKKRPERYERYIRLLLFGGFKVLRGMLQRELKKQSISLKIILSNFKERLFEKITNTLQRQQLRQVIEEDGEENGTNLMKWDISLIATTLLTVFDSSLNSGEKRQIERLLAARRGYAEAAIGSLDQERFLHYWTDLTGSIKCLAMVLDEDVQRTCDNLIEESTQLANFEVEFNQLQECCTCVKTLKDIYEEHLEELVNDVRQMKELGLPFKEPKTLEAKIITHGNDKEKTELAERILLTVWQQALEEVDDSTNFEEVRHQVDRILRRIRASPDVTDINVTQQCILLSMQCRSAAAVLHLLEYFSDNSFQECINNIAEDLSSGLDESFIITANITNESLNDIRSNRNMESDKKEYGISIPITIASANGVKTLWSFLSSNEFQQNIDELAKSINSAQQDKPENNFMMKSDISCFSRLFDGYDTDNSSTESLSRSASTEDKLANILSAAIEDETIQTPILLGGEGARLTTEFELSDDRSTTEIQSTIHRDVGERKTGIDHIDTQTQISIGDRIRPINRSLYGTVGPFVRIKETGELCFLTVRHIFDPLEIDDRYVVGRKVVHCINTNDAKEVNERVCGEILASEYSEMLDVAVVKLSKDHIANRYSFSSVVEEQRQGKDITKVARMLRYANIQTTVEPRKLTLSQTWKMRVIKIGSKTGLTEGRFQKDKLEDKINTQDESVLWKHPKQNLWQVVPYRNHIHVEGFGKETFATEEDYGSAVYLLDENKQLHCVGILCRQLQNTTTFLVGPIEDILHRLGQKVGLTLAVDKYEEVADTIDSYDEELFNYVLMRGKEREKHVRVNIVGFFAEGKTTLTRRLLNESLEDCTCTDGIDVHVGKCKIAGKNWKTCDTFDLYEECSKRLVDVVESKSQKVSDDGKTLDQSVKTAYKKGEPTAIARGRRSQMSAIGNMQMRHSQFTPACFPDSVNAPGKQDKKLLRLFSKHLRDTVGHEGPEKLIANIWDFGGQFIYYATHQIFLSKDAVYLLCFDLTKDLEAMVIDCDFPDRKEMMKNSLRYWVNSIYASVGEDTENVESPSNPVIIIVGTHKDKFHGDIDKKFDEVFDLFSGTKLCRMIYERPFAVASKDMNDKTVGELRNAIYEIGLKNSEGKTWPAKWIQLQVIMLQEEKSILRYADIVSMNEGLTFPLSGETEIKSFLNYHHAKGTIVFFDEDDLNKYVVTRPQFLVDAFKRIITARWFCRWTQNARQSWKRLTSEAILERSLLDEVWREGNTSDFLEYREVLLKFLERHRILAEVRQIDEDTGKIQNLGKYMIPSMLRRELNGDTEKEFLTEKTFTQTVLGLELESEVIATVYTKATAAILGKWPPLEYNEQIQMYPNAGFYRLDLQHAGIAKRCESSIELTVVSLCPPNRPDRIVCDRFRRYVEMVIRYEFRKQQSKQNRMPYRHYIKCNNTDHNGIGSRKSHYIDDIINQVKVCCPDNKSHPIVVSQAISEWFRESKISATESDAIRRATREDRLIFRIAQEYGMHWKCFGNAIGLSADELKPIDSGEKTFTVCIFQMFKVWIKKFPDWSSYDKTSQKELPFYEDNLIWDKIFNCFDF